MIHEEIHVTSEIQESWNKGTIYITPVNKLYAGKTYVCNRNHRQCMKQSNIEEHMRCVKIFWLYGHQC